MNELKFENADVIFYERTAGNNNDISRHMPRQKEENFNHTSFTGLNSDAILGLFPAGNIVSISFKPVCVKFRNGDSEVSRISAESAIISLKTRDILFKDNVNVQSGDRQLRVDSLNFNPDTSMLKTHQNYIYETELGRWRGKALSSDIYLSSIRFSLAQ